jgi:beta-xylosidase
MTMKAFCFFPLIGTVLLVGCSTQATPAAVATELPTIAPTNTALPTQTPTALPPTDTPAPTPTKTPMPPTPTATESPFLFRDDFEGELSSEWEWLGEAPDFWSLSAVPGALRIILQPTNISDIDPVNFLIQTAPDGNFEISTLVQFAPSSNFQFAGLLIYQGQGSAIQFGRAFAQCPVAGFCKGNAIYFDIVEQSGGGKPNFATEVVNEGQAYLRLRREGITYTGYYSEDGSDWIEIGVHESNITPDYIGLIASQAYEAETTADFDYFTIEALP